MNMSRFYRKQKNKVQTLVKKNIVIPITENKLMFNGEMRFGRVFDLAAYVLRDVEEPLSETGSVSEPFIYRIVDHYDTWVSNGVMLYRIDFYIVE